MFKLLTKNIQLSTQHKLIILVLLALGLNFNTLFNEYAVDDAIVLTENKFVEKGIGGIPEIVGQDYFKGLEGLKGTELSGGRYRPFSLVIFALEHQFFGENPFISHSINLLFFAILIALLFKLLQTYIFKDQNKNLAFITCLLFVVHPIHTEVIANVKSRDELIAFILLIVSLITFIKHTTKYSIGMLSISLFCFFLALLTKESAVAFIGIFPLILYFFFNQTIKKSIQFSIPLILVFIGYLGLRFLVIGFNFSNSDLILNVPFLLATPAQAFATKVFILFNYCWLLVFPYSLSSDYSYNQIPYIDLISFKFIFSALFILSLVVYAFLTFKIKSLYSFSILYFFLAIFLVTNFVINIGAPLAERLLFQPSLACCIVLASFYIRAEQRFKLVSNGILLIILILFSLKTFVRNAEWKNNDTLYSVDVITSPNSIRTNAYEADLYLAMANVETNPILKNEYFKKTVHYGERCIEIYSNDAFRYMNLGSGYFGLHDYFKAADLWKQAYKLDPNEPEAKKATHFISSILLKHGNAFYEQGKISEAIKYYQKSVELNNENIEAWYKLGGNYYLINDTINAAKAWGNVKMLNPNHLLKKENFYKTKRLF